jgi:hypothetical protein
MAKARRKTKRRTNASPNTMTARKRGFLERFRLSGNITAACDGIVPRSVVYVWLDKDDAFKAAFEDARAEAGDRLEEEARRRAHDGWLEPVFSKGVRAWDGVDEDGNVVHPESEHAVRLVPAVMRKYSDALMALLLKGAKPEKFRERFEHTGKDGGPIQSETGLRIEVVQSRDAGGTGG